MDIETIRDWLRNFAEEPENRKQMSVDIHQQIWNMIQSIDIELEAQKTTNPKKDSELNKC